MVLFGSVDLLNFYFAAQGLGFNMGQAGKGGNLGHFFESSRIARFKFLPMFCDVKMCDGHPTFMAELLTSTCSERAGLSPFCHLDTHMMTGYNGYNSDQLLRGIVGIQIVWNKFAR